MERELPKKFGDESEILAVRFLEQEGFIVLERNYFARKLGEIDIIAKQDDILHFIEFFSTHVRFSTFGIRSWISIDIF
jgi:putative endonuclease